MNTSILRYLTNKWVLSAVLFLLLIPLLPKVSSKYKVEVTESRNLSPEGGYMYYHDLDADGDSERILSSTNMWGDASFIIHNSRNELVNQWNMENSKLNFQGKLFFYDLDKDGKSEVFMFTRKKDSILCEISSFSDSVNKPFHSFFVDRIGNYDSSMDYTKTNDISVTGFYPIEFKGSSHLYFSVITGFTAYPRNIYRYNFNTKELIKSEHLGNRTGIVDVLDIDQDGQFELILSANSASNNRWFNPSYFKRSDESSWQMILDQNLEFKFPPKEIPSEFSSVAQDTIVSDEQTYVIAASFIKRDEDGPSTLYKISPMGKILDSVEIKANSGTVLKNPNDHRILIYSNIEGEVLSFNYDLELLHRYDIPKNMIVNCLDIDLDGLNEWVCLDYNNGALQIFENNFKKTAELFLPEFSQSKSRMTGLKFKNKEPYLWFQLDDKEFEMQYAYNPWYLLKWVLYFLIYLLLVLVVWTVMRLQQLKEKENRELETKMSELQFKAIKNQLDPHFVFNAMNTIAEMKISDKLEVDQFICEFSDLMRKTITSSDKIIHTLKEELDYVKNYIRLQQISAENNFDVNFDIESSLLEEIVPKHILYSYVENAIKHGFFGIEDKGVLNISIQNGHIDEGLILTIENSGNTAVQLAEKDKRRSTGNGMRIMNEIFSLFQQRYGKRILVEANTVIDKQSKKECYVVRININPTNRINNTHK